VATPVAWLVDDAPALLQMAAVVAAAAPAYLIALRLGFSDAWRDLLAALRRVVPARLLIARGRKRAPVAAPQLSDPA
jgi:hypothetical protein